VLNVTHNGLEYYEFITGRGLRKRESLLESGLDGAKRVGRTLNFLCIVE